MARAGKAIKPVKIVTMADRAIMQFSPARALDRIRSRVAIGALMNFDGASRGRRLKGWKAPATDADAASQPGRARLRQLSRDMIRNAPFATRAQAVVVNNVIGAGVMPSLSGGSKRARTRADEALIAHLNSTDLDVFGEQDLSGIQAVVMNSVFEAGEVLVVRRPASASRGLSIPLQIEIIEIDHLNPVIQGHDGNEVVDGIEYDAAGKAVAYHLYKQHPGAARRGVTLETVRVPASEVIHVRRLSRAGQTRGVPWLAPVMLTVGELRDYQEAQNVKQKMSALMAGVIESDAASGAQGVAPEGQHGLDELAPGALVHAGPGQKVQWTDPPKVDGYDSVMRLGLQAVAMGIGITLEALSGDLSGVNFASSRVGRIEMDSNVAAWQRFIILQLCKGIGRWSLDAYRLIEPQSARGISIGWTPPARPLIDPNKEVPSIVKKIDAKLTSRQREIRKLGGDPDVIAKEIAEDAEKDAAAALKNPPPDIETPALPGAAQPAPPVGVKGKTGDIKK